MSAKRQSVLRGCGRTIVLVLLTPITMLNASQALTLCVGHDGRVALELLVQDRCTCEMRPCGTDAPGDAISGSTRVADGSGLPCMDIPIPGGSCDDRARVHASPTHKGRCPIPIGVAGPLGHSLTFMDSITGPGDAPRSLLASVSHSRPLDSILLQV